jgi:CRISPR type I-E-associated protein CasB/Cse2
MSEPSKSDLGKAIAEARLDVIMAWWRALHPKDAGNRGDTGGRARLRRAHDLNAVMMEETFIELIRAVQEASRNAAGSDLSNDYIERTALAGAVLAEIKPSNSHGRDKASFARVLGGEKPENRALKSLRFEALMKAMIDGTNDEKLTALRRAAAILGTAAFDEHQLVRDIFSFTDDTALRWAMAYCHVDWQPSRKSKAETV